MGNYTTYDPVTLLLSFACHIPCELNTNTIYSTYFLWTDIGRLYQLLWCPAVDLVKRLTGLTDSSLSAPESSAILPSEFPSLLVTSISRSAVAHGGGTMSIEMPTWLSLSDESASCGSLYSHCLVCSGVLCSMDKWHTCNSATSISWLIT